MAMSSIIPVKPFGKDPAQFKKDLEARVSEEEKSNTVMANNSSSTSSFSSSSSSDFILAYDYSGVTYEIDRAHKVLWLNNVPYNIFKDNKWHQGVWFEVGLFLELLPGGGVSEKHSFVDWIDCNKPENSCIIPPLPLLFTFWAAQYAVEAQWKRSIKSLTERDAQYLAQFNLNDPETSIYTSTRMFYQNEKNSLRHVFFEHGVGLSGHLAQYSFRGIYADYNTNLCNLFGCNDPVLIQKVLSWRAGSDPKWDLGLMIGPQNDPCYLETKPNAAGNQFVMVVSSSNCNVERFARGLLTNPGRFKVSH